MFSRKTTSHHNHMDCRILILGDSSSSGVGEGQRCFPVKLFQLLHNKVGVHILNSAVPGTTSADVSRLFVSELSKLRFDYVIIYLGNNEAVSGVAKGFFSPLRARIKDFFFKPQPSQFRPILSPEPFKFEYNIPLLDVATSPKEFGYNLRLIIRSAIKLGSKVILINPIANQRFPCGVGAPNSTYFCYLDNLEQLGYEISNIPVDEPSNALIKGLEYFTTGKYDEAIDTWSALVSMDNILGFISRHNLSCAQARRGETTAESQLSALLGEYEIYDSIVLYNLAHIRQEFGDLAGAKDLFHLAYEKDTSIYRIKQAYRDVIRKLKEMDGISLVDLETILKPSHFIDYCHPNEDGHELVAQALAGLILSDMHSPSCTRESRYQTYFPTPNYLRNPGQTLADYYCVDWEIDQIQISRAITEFKSGNRFPDESIGKCIKNFFKSNLKHPIFTASIKFNGDFLPRKNEILSFPEYYIYRILINYYRYFEKRNLLKIPKSTINHLFSSKDYENMILRSQNNGMNMHLDIRISYYKDIMEKINYQLIYSKNIYRVIIGERIRTVLIWYTREALRYGTQSRLSMLYARWEIDKIIEGIIVAIVIAHNNNLHDKLNDLGNLFDLIIHLIEIHERNLFLYCNDDDDFSVKEYHMALLNQKEAIINCIDTLFSNNDISNGIDAYPGQG